MIKTEVYRNPVQSFSTNQKTANKSREKKNSTHQSKSTSTAESQKTRLSRGNEEKKNSHEAKEILPNKYKKTTNKTMTDVSSKSTEKGALAVKAKKKFLDNLSRFQKESKQPAASSSAFDRSCNGLAEHLTNSNVRRSFRTPRPFNDRNHVMRQSLRARDLSGRNFNSNNSVRTTVSRGINLDERRDAVNQRKIKPNEKKSKKSSPSSSLNEGTAWSACPGSHSSPNLETIKKEPVINTNCTDWQSHHQQVMTSQTAFIGSASDKSLPRSSSGLQRKQSRAEAAMEKHKERMRKASQHTAPSLPPRQQLTPKLKRRAIRQPDGLHDDVTTVKSTKDKNPGKDLAENLKSDTARSVQCETSYDQRKPPILSTSVAVVQEHLLNANTANKENSINEQNSFELLDIRSPMIKRKNLNRGNVKRHKAKQTEQHSNHRVSSQTSKKKNLLCPSVQLPEEGKSDPQINNAGSKPVAEPCNSSLTEIDFQQSANEIALNEESRRLHHENDVFKLGNNPTVALDILTNGQMKNTSNSTNSSQKDTVFVATKQCQTASDLRNADCEDTAMFCISEGTFDSNTNVKLCNSPQKPGNTSVNKEVQKREKRNSYEGAVERIKEKRGLLCNSCEADETNVTTYPDFDSKGFQNQKETIDENNRIKSEKISLKFGAEAEKKQKTLQTCTTGKMSQETGPVSISRSFRRLPAKQRRAKLRKVVLKYKAEYGSDSSFSEGSGDESDIDMKWLEAGNIGSVDDDWIFLDTTLKQKNKQLIRKQKKEISPQVETTTNSKVNLKERNGEDADIGKAKPTDKAPTKSLEQKTERSKEPNRTAALVKKSHSPPRDVDANHDDVNAKSESAGVGSMLSMWENRKAKKHAAFDATRDEAFDSSTMGRLKGAKALFENMMKKSNGEDSFQADRNAPGSPKTPSRMITDVRSVFEQKPTNSVVTRSFSMKTRARSPKYAPPPTIKSHSSVSLPVDENAAEISDSDAAETADCNAVKPIDSDAVKTADSYPVDSNEAKNTDSNPNKTVHSNEVETADSNAAEDVDSDAFETADAFTDKTADSNAAETADSNAGKTVDSDAVETADAFPDKTADSKVVETADANAAETVDSDAVETADAGPDKTAHSHEVETADANAAEVVDSVEAETAFADLDKTADSNEPEAVAFDAVKTAKADPVKTTDSDIVETADSNAVTSAKTRDLSSGECVDDFEDKDLSDAPVLSSASSDEEDDSLELKKQITVQTSGEKKNVPAAWEEGV